MGHEKTNGEFAFAHYSEKVQKGKISKIRKGVPFLLLIFERNIKI